MIRVVHVITSLDVGGAQRMLLKLLAGSDAQAFQHAVVSLVDGGGFWEEAVASGKQVIGLGLKRSVPDPRGVVRLRRVLRALRPQLLQTWLYHADLLGAVASRGSGSPPLVWNLRRSVPGSGGLRWMTTRACAALSSGVDAVVVNSERGLVAHRNIGYRPKRWERIPNGFDVEAFRRDPSGGEAVRLELGLDPGEVVALVVARWHPDKGIDTLFEAIRRLPAAPRIRFVLAGEGLDDTHPILTEWARSLPASHPVDLLGPRRDVPGLMSACDWLVSPSRTEGFPNVIGEAMSCELPCVVTDAGESAELLGPAGRVVPPDSPEALAAALEEMARMPVASRRELGRRGRLRVAERHSLESVVGQYESLYRSLVPRG